MFVIEYADKSVSIRPIASAAARVGRSAFRRKPAALDAAPTSAARESSGGAHRHYCKALFVRNSSSPNTSHHAVVECHQLFVFPGIVRIPHVRYATRPCRSARQTLFNLHARGIHEKPSPLPALTASTSTSDTSDDTTVPPPPYRGESSNKHLHC
jgi:hypothetical protein